MSYKNFVEAAEDKSNHKFGITVERVYKGGDFWGSHNLLSHSYPQFYLDDEDIEYLYNKYRSRVEGEIREEKERKRKEKQDQLHRKIEELNKLKEELENE